MLILSRRPFIIDLESTNGTIVNDEQIPESRYYELKLGDGAYYSLTLSNTLNIGRFLLQ